MSCNIMLYIVIQSINRKKKCFQNSWRKWQRKATLEIFIVYVFIIQNKQVFEWVINIFEITDAGYGIRTISLWVLTYLYPITILKIILMAMNIGGPRTTGSRVVQWSPHKNENKHILNFRFKKIVWK